MSFKRTSGFTLIELIMTIVLLGIIGGVLAPVIQNSVEIYAAERSRAVLVQKGRLALERIAREVREAVPNSLSVVTDAGGNTGIEFLQISTGGRYIDLTDSYGAAFIDPTLRFSAGVGMSSLYSLGTNPALAAGDLLIIANTAPGDLIAGTTVVPLIGIAPTTLATDGTIDGQILNFAIPPATFTFPGGSPGRRYFTANTNHEIGLNGGVLYWHTGAGLAGYDGIGGWSPADPMLVDGVSALVFAYDPGAAIGVAVLSMTLSLTDGTETIDLYQEIQIRNAM
jgi:MSHA biogenesis protein MshO